MVREPALRLPPGACSGDSGACPRLSASRLRGSHLGNATPRETPSREQPERRRLGDS